MKVKYFVPKSDSASRQIQAWARGGDYENDSRDIGRSSGQLSDNITEQRVLQTRLLDLGRERYKAITEREYQKNRFIDRQQQKTRVMRDLLRNIDLEQYRHKSCNTVDVLREKSLRMRLMILARQQGHNVDDEAALERLVDEQLAARTTRDEHEESDDRFGPLTTTDASILDSRPQHPKSALPTIHRTPRSRLSLSVGGSRFERNGRTTESGVRHSVEDPRCANLLKTLCPNYVPKRPTVTVTNLMCQIDTLALPWRSKTDMAPRQMASTAQETFRLPTAIRQGSMVAR